LALVQAHPAARPPFSCPVVGVGRSGVELSLRCWCDDAGAAAQLKSDMLEQAAKRLPQAGIEIA
ncbi:MAG: hypothetical protein LC136_12860, partial [Burkholderiales bacterium]|nr:hypothetical protein [Burkholderiales bacterium]